LLYGQPDGSLVKQPFDADRLELTGPAVRFGEGLELVARIFPAFAASSSGVVAYYPSQSGGTLAVLVDRNGAERTLFSAPDLWSPRFAPDGNRIAFSRAGSNPGGRDLWVYSLREQTQARLTRDFSNAVDGVFSPDGQRLAFAGAPTGVAAPDLYLVDADGVGGPKLVLERADGQYQPAFAEGGAALVFVDRTGVGDRLMRVGLPGGAGATVEPLQRAGVNEASPAFSPDGHWIAFHSSESGQTEVYVRPYPGPGPRVVISSGGGSEPVWATSGRELFYRTTSVLMSATLTTGSGISVTSRKVLFAAAYLRGRGNRNFDVAPDGNRFVFVKNVNPPRLVVRLVATTAPEPR
jgi:Tol biopolymer transport system component